MSDRDSIIEKVQALLSKVPERGATEAEAASALEMAHKLLLRHNLSMAEVEDVKAEEGQVIEQREDAVAADGTPRRGSTGWQGILATVIGKHFFVRVLANRGTLYFIGRPDNVAAVRELNAWVVRQVAQLALEACYADGREPRYEKLWLRSCRLGIVARISDRLEDVAAAQAAESVKVRALIVRYDDENEKFVEDRYGRLSRGYQSPSNEVHYDGYHTGRMVGADISLSPPSQQVKGGPGK